MKNETANDGFVNNIVAVYWDWENIHASVFDLANGERSYHNQSRAGQQETLVNVQAVMDYVKSLGEVVINRAYSNWQYFSRYRVALNEAGIDLLQLFPRGKNMKNGADIRLALDVMEDINHYPHITHIAVIGSDSDFIGLSQKVKQLGRVIIGIGVQGATNNYWVKSCNEFKYYQTLLEKSGASSDAKLKQQRLNIRIAEELLMNAVRRLISQRGENRIPKAQLKGIMRRLDPTFDETNYGFPTFSAFLDNFSASIKILDSNSGGHVGLRQEAYELEFSAKVNTFLEPAVTV